MTHRRAAADTSVPSAAHPDGGTDHNDVDDGDMRVAGELDSGDLRRLLATRAGAVAAAERDRALRAFDGDTAARRALSTMAVRIAVQVVEPAVAAAEAGDRAEAAVAELFVGE
jgi:hypothetical protein